MDAVLEKEEDIRAELNVFQNHSAHPNLVKFFGAFVKRDSVAEEQIWIVMEVRQGQEKPLLIALLTVIVGRPDMMYSFSLFFLLLFLFS